jgi:nitrite reductase (NO-forming)
MADPLRPDSDEEAQGPTGEEAPAGMPGWVKVIGILVGIAILVGVVIMMTGVEHGPGLHGPAGADHADDAEPIAGAPQLEVAAGELQFDPERIALPAGIPVNVALTSTDILHDLVVDELDFHLAADRNETAIGGLVFTEPGTYMGYCSVPGHRDAGMELEFEVFGAGDHADLQEFFREFHG